MKKNVLYIAWVLTLCLSLLVGCSPKEPAADRENTPAPGVEVTGTPGTADPDGEQPPAVESPDPGQTGAGPALEWDRDAGGHWKSGPDGEKTEAAPHSLNGENVCTVCGSEVLQFDGLGDVFNYDGEGRLLRSSRYAADGTVLSEGYYEYAEGEDGEVYLAVFTELYEDGTRCRNEYDPWEDLISWFRYGGDGAVLSEVHYEYTHDAEGVSHMVKSTDLHPDGTQYISEYNEYGEQTAWLVYAADGSLQREECTQWEHDAEGRRLSQTVWVNGKLTREVRYANYTNGSGWWTREQSVTTYYEDGSKQVTEYNENGGILSATTYDADGNVKSFG